MLSLGPFRKLGFLCLLGQVGAECHELSQKRSVSNLRGKVGVELSIQGTFLTPKTTWLLPKSHKRDLWKLAHPEEMALGDSQAFPLPIPHRGSLNLHKL